MIRQPGLLRQSGLFLSTDQIAVSLRRTDGSGHEDHQDHEDPNESIFGFVILVSFVIFVPLPSAVSARHASGYRLTVTAFTREMASFR